MLRAGQNREVTMLTEDGLYEVLMQSRKPIAKAFKKEVKKINVAPNTLITLLKIFIQH